MSKRIPGSRVCQFDHVRLEQVGRLFRGRGGQCVPAEFFDRFEGNDAEGFAVFRADFAALEGDIGRDDL